MVMSACISMLSVAVVVHLFLLGVGANKVSIVCCCLGRGRLLESADSVTQICENRLLCSHSNLVVDIYQVCLPPGMTVHLQMRAWTPSKRDVLFMPQLKHLFSSVKTNCILPRQNIFSYCLYKQVYICRTQNNMACC